MCRFSSDVSYSHVFMTFFIDTINILIKEFRFIIPILDNNLKIVSNFSEPFKISIYAKGEIKRNKIVKYFNKTLFFHLHFFSCSSKIWKDQTIKYRSISIPDNFYPRHTWHITKYENADLDGHGGFFSLQIEKVNFNFDDFINWWFDFTFSCLKQNK